MKIITALILFTAVATLLTGCVQMQMDTTIDEDGSGTMELNLSISKIVTEATAELGTDGMDDDLVGITKMVSVDKNAAQESIKDFDVDLVKYESGTVNGCQSLQTVFKFADLENMGLALRAIMSGGDDGLALMDNGDGNFVLGIHDYNWSNLENDEDENVEITSGFDEIDTDKMQKQMALMGRLMGAMSELEISMKLTVPGDIIKSNAPEVVGRTSVWNLDSTSLMSGNSDMKPVIVFSGKGLKIKTVN